MMRPARTYAAWLAVTALLALLGGMGSACRQSVPSVCEDLNCGCLRQDDCGALQVCVVGTCRAPGSNTATVFVDIMPPNDSGLLPQAATPSPRDLGAGLGFDITLQRPLSLSGTVTGLGVGGRITAERILADAEPEMPSAHHAPEAELDDDHRFELNLMPATYRVTVQPTTPATSKATSKATSTTTADAMARPPLQVVYDLTQDWTVTIDYPTDAALVVVSGRLVSGSAPVEGAEIYGVARSDHDDSNGDEEEEELRSTTSVTDADGAFTLRFPPGGLTYELRSRAGTTNAMVPQRAFTNLGITADGASGIELDLNLPAQPTPLPVFVTDATGAPIEEAVVFLEGELDGDELAGGRFSTKATTDTAGRTTLALWPGVYDLTVAPPLRSSSATRLLRICVPRSGATLACDEATPLDAAPTELSIALEARVRLTGTVVDHDGVPVPAARTTFTARTLERRPTFAATTDAQGAFALWIDPPAQGAPSTQVDVVVEPDPGLGLPRHRETILVGAVAAQEINLALDASSFAFGAVFTPSGEPLAGVILAFYATAASSQDSTAASDDLVLIGVGQSGEGGEFVAPLPSVTEP